MSAVADWLATEISFVWIATRYHCMGITNTTHRYVEADLAMKEKAPARLEPPNTKLRRFHASDSLLDCVSRRFALFATFQYWGSASSSLGK